MVNPEPSVQDIVSFLDAEQLDRLLPDSNQPGQWRFAGCQLIRAQLRGDDNARLLQLQSRVALQDWQGKNVLQLDITLHSAAWLHADNWPPLLDRLAIDSGQLTAGKSRLQYQIVALDAQSANVNGDSFWQKYLFPDNQKLIVDTLPAVSPAPLATQLCQQLQQWLQQQLAVDTVDGALECVKTGPVGAFGPVETQLLKRSNQTDLQADVCCLAKIDNATQAGPEAAVYLTLYGERFGSWLLHRRTAVTIKPRRNDAKAVTEYRYELLVAQSAEALIAQAGLGDLEKALFQQAAVLPYDRLYADGDADSVSTKTPAVLDLSSVPARNQRYLQSLFSMTQSGSLNTADLDLVHRLARHLAKK